MGNVAHVFGVVSICVDTALARTSFLGGICVDTDLLAHMLYLRAFPGEMCIYIWHPSCAHVFAEWDLS